MVDCSNCLMMSASAAAQTVSMYSEYCNIMRPTLLVSVVRQQHLPCRC
eukprot:COSAG02_NODE_4418_length_5382_cov_23.288283_4_plen_48_part_00